MVYHPQHAEEMKAGGAKTQRNKSSKGQTLTLGIRLLLLGVWFLQQPKSPRHLEIQISMGRQVWNEF